MREGKKERENERDRVRESCPFFIVSFFPADFEIITLGSQFPQRLSFTCTFRSPQNLFSQSAYALFSLALQMSSMLSTS